MLECRRGAAPELLAEHGAEIGAEYARRRRENPRYRFQWPQRGGQKLYEVARAALAETGALEPAPDITAADRIRARRTIDILDLNRAGACTSRLAAIKMIRRRESDEELADVPYRFLIPLVAA